ncbi:MAG TPA: hypothetical protein VMW49_09850 [Candidatus Dormibacteraeota bacterium]|nr:hypothetical protein [Candidatus Dormibacteraeota bacterium]
MLIFLHERVAFILIALGLLGAAWTFIGLRRDGQTPGGVRAMLILTEGLAILEGVFGLILYGSGLRPANVPFHVMYGVASVLVLPVAWVLSARSSSRGEALYLGFGALLLAGVAFRAIMVGAA